MTNTNTEQSRYWNQDAGPKWVRNQTALDAQISPLGFLAQDKLLPQAGEKILDIGCGCGQTSLQLVEKVGPEGHVTGADISATMLAHAQSRATTNNVSFLQADGQTHEFPAAHFDAVFSRFGVMFFADPSAAFSNIRTSLKPGGRLAFVCWQALADNPWMTLPIMAAAEHLTMPPPAAPDAPGPFAFANKERVQRILESAGFEQIQLEPVSSTLQPGGDLDFEQTVEFMMEIGPMTALLKDASEAQKQIVTNAVRDAMKPYISDNGIHMGCAVWLVTAVNPH